MTVLSAVSDHVFGVEGREDVKISVVGWAAALSPAPRRSEFRHQHQVVQDGIRRLLLSFCSVFSLYGLRFYVNFLSDMGIWGENTPV